MKTLIAVLCWAVGVFYVLPAIDNRLDPCRFIVCHGGPR